MGRSHQKRLDRGQGARGRSVVKDAKFSGCSERFHAAAITGCGGERSRIWAAVSLSMTTIGPPHLGQSQSGRGCVAVEVSGSVCGGAPVIESIAAEPWRAADWRGNRSGECGQNLWEADATGNGTETHRTIRSAAWVDCCQRSRANER
jgi:hypothetical protein